MAVTKVTPAGISLTQIGKNLFYNSDFAVAQRGTSFTGMGTTTQYTLDGWKYLSGGSEEGRFTLSQSTTVPAGTGHKQSVKIDVTTVDSSVASTHSYYCEALIEAQNCSHLDYGAATAKSLCISFWTRSSTTGDYQFMLEAPDGSRAYSTTYNIASADTWEKKKIVIAGDSSGTINNDNGIGLICRFTLTAGSAFQGGTQNAWASTANNMYAAGSTLNLFSSTDNDWYIAGLLVEEGDEVTDYPFEDYNTTLIRCGRYFERLMYNFTATEYVAVGFAASTSSCITIGSYRTAKRANPTMSATAANTWDIIYGGGSLAEVGTVNDVDGGEQTFVIVATNVTGSPLTQGDAVQWRVDSGDQGDAYIDISSEL